MVQVMSFDIKIHQISIDSKHKQCFDLIASDKVHYHLHCRKYSDNSGDNENVLCFSHFIQLWFKSCPLTLKGTDIGISHNRYKLARETHTNPLFL